MRVTLLLLLLAVAASHSKKVQTKPQLSGLSCSTCKLLVSSVSAAIEGRQTLDQIIKIASAVCPKLGLDDRISPICGQMVQTMAPTLLPILLKVGLQPEWVCYELGYCPLNGTKRAAVRPRRQARAEIIPRDENVMGTILHLSDFHWDDMYQAGSVVECNEPVCCRASSKPINASNPGRKAGKWGEMTCDIPVSMLGELLASAAQYKPDLVVITGDNTPHDIWNQTKELTLQRLQRAAEIVTKYFPNTPVVPTIGNHDTYPVDQFNRIGPDKPHLDNFEWLLEGLSQSWGPWLTKHAIDQADADRAVTDLRNFGYFSISPLPGLRVVSLNTQWGDFFNWYNLLQEDQGARMFQWIEDTLRFSRFNHEKVMIIGHIPPSFASIFVAHTYIDRYRSIYHRNQDIIVGQLYGHTHQDQFALMYTDYNSTTATGVVYITSSVTAFGHQPGYRLMKYNKNFELLDYDHYTTDITTANEADKPEWKLEYNARSEYNLKDLSPASWDDLWHRFQSDDALFQKYYHNMNTRTATGPASEAQKQEILCGITTTIQSTCN